MADKRAALADYLEERVSVTGMFEKYSLQFFENRQWRVALLQDVYVEIDGKQIDLGHMWLQHAEPLRQHDLRYGDRIRCSCRVTSYRKRLRVPNKDGLMVVQNYSLSWPTEVEILCRSMRPADSSPAHSVQPAGSIEPESAISVGHIFETRQLAAKLGGWKALRQLIDALECSPRSPQTIIS
jgi:hypothetical protein